MDKPNSARRRLLAGTAAALAIGPLPVRAQAFPSRNIRVVIPTAQGGGAERLARVFDDFWGAQLKTSFEYGFFPGAAGQVGFVVFIN
jgi:tripartite-type tricarboxylate transporter receptor subunit TctC